MYSVDYCLELFLLLKIYVVRIWILELFFFNYFGGVFLQKRTYWMIDQNWNHIQAYGFLGFFFGYKCKCCSMPQLWKLYLSSWMFQSLRGRILVYLADFLELNRCYSATSAINGAFRCWATKEKARRSEHRGEDKVAELIKSFIALLCCQYFEHCVNLLPWCRRCQISIFNCTDIFLDSNHYMDISLWWFSVFAIE